MKNGLIIGAGFLAGVFVGACIGVTYKMSNTELYMTCVSDDNGDHIVGVYTTYRLANIFGYTYGEIRGVGQYTVSVWKCKTNRTLPDEPIDPSDNANNEIGKAILVDGNPTWINK